MRKKGSLGYVSPQGVRAVVGKRAPGVRGEDLNIAGTDLDEKTGIFDAEYRVQLLKDAKAGKEEVLAYLRDCLGVRTLVLNKRKLIDHGVLVGARR